MTAEEIERIDSEAYARGAADGAAGVREAEDGLTYLRGYRAGRGPRPIKTYDPAKVKFTFGSVECVSDRGYLAVSFRKER